MNTELHYKTITELAGLLRTRKISPVEVTKAMLRRIEELDPRYKSYATVTTDYAMEEAKGAEDEITRGNYKGPLHGVPIAVKDLCFTDGVRTMGGSKVMADHVPNFDATVVARLKAAGERAVGKAESYRRGYGWLQPGVRRAVESLERGSVGRCVLQWVRCVYGARAMLRFVGKRHRGVHTVPCSGVWNGGAEANVGKSKPLRSAGVSRIARSRRAFDTQLGGRGDYADGNRRSGPERPNDTTSPCSQRAGRY